MPKLISLNDFVDSVMFEPVTVFLTNGVKLTGGAITSKCSESICLTRNGSTQLVMKHAIATIMPDNSREDHGNNAY